MKSMNFKLSTGELDLHITKEEQPFDSLLSVGERINPKRPFIFISKVIGRYIPTSLKTLEKVATNLVGLVESEYLLVSDKVSVISLSETALGLGVMVHQILQDNGVKNLNVFTTRHKTSNNVLYEFEEPHSHLPCHRIYSSSHDEFLINTEVLVLIDDEITTGNTLKNLYNSMNLKNIKEVIILTVADWSGTEETLYWGKTVVKKYSLISGSYKWTAKEGVVLKQLPYNSLDYDNSIVLSNHNFRKPSFNFLGNSGKFNINTCKDTLVVYYNELLPYAIKLYYSTLTTNKDVYFLAVSSSPIELGGDIKSKIEYTGYYSNVPVYLYNFNEAIENKEIVVKILTEPNSIPFNETMLSLNKWVK